MAISKPHREIGLLHNLPPSPTRSPSLPLFSLMSLSATPMEPQNFQKPKQTTVQDPETQKEFSAVNCYFMQQDGATFKTQVKYAPYFLISTKPECEHDVEAFLRRRYEGKILNVEMVDKEDLDLKNHLSGLQQRYLKVIFSTVQDLMDVRREVMPMVKRNQQKCEAQEAYEQLHQMETDVGGDGDGRSHHRATERGG